LIAVSGQPGALTETAVRAMADRVEKPIIFPLSNPTSRAEATPEDLMHWTNGRVIMGTGSPFPPVRWKDRHIPIDQTNNSYIFPGLGLGVLAVNARRVTDTMFMAAAKALATLSPAKHQHGGRLLPPVNELRDVAFTIAYAVAHQALKDGVAPPCDGEALADRIRAEMWGPVYRPYRRVKS
jgi:malate dehydrogenase (oxaloacetate-decarboxylating)